MTSHRMPTEIERWTIWNAAGALVAAAVSVVMNSVEPSVLAAIGSLSWVLWRHAQLGAANLITISRMCLLCGVLAIAPERQGWVAAAAFALFALDGLDGWVARKLNQASAFGAHFDMETDGHALLLLDLQLITRAGFGRWVLIAGLLRYVYVLARHWVGPREIRERRSRVGRWVFSLVITSRIVGCIPGLRVVAEPLLLLATVAVCVSFAPDFNALRAAPSPAHEGVSEP